MHRAAETMQSLCLHFETRANKPPVFRMTEALIRDSYERAGSPSLSWTVNEDPDRREWMRHAQGLITSNEHLAPAVFPRHDIANQLPALRWIHIIGAGIEPLLPLDWLPPGVVLTNNSGVHWDKARESGMMALLALNGKLPQLVSQQRRAQWNPIFTRGIAGRSVLVIGLGDMGGAVADGARRLGMQVTGVRLNPAPHPHADRVIGLAELDPALGEADFVVIATPLTPATHHLLDHRRMALMKPGAGLFNIGRGGCLDHDALAGALASGHLSGAVLDVFDPEPLPATSPLWAMDNVIITPHVSADDADRYLPLTFDLVFANAARLQRGEPLLNVVDPVRGY
jgi:phosphoglycerate dehydrogenase-like enzyme